MHQETKRAGVDRCSVSFLGYSPVYLKYRVLYKRFTNPTPHSFVTLSSTTKLGVGLPNKVMSTCELSKLGLYETKKENSEREFSFEVFSSSLVRVL